MRHSLKPHSHCLGSHRFVQVKTNRYFVIKRGTFETKNDRVLTVTVLPGVAPVLLQ